MPISLSRGFLLPQSGDIKEAIIRRDSEIVNAILTGIVKSGTATFATAATKAVAFSINEFDAAYHVVVTGNVNETFWVTAKATTGFTINSSNATSTAVVSWILTR